MARYELKTVVPLLFLCFIIGATARSFSTRLIFVLAGFFVVLLTAPTRVSNFIVNWRLESSNNAIYSLDHGRLNLQLPVESMWMNMGYWEHTSDFKTACERLLFQIIQKAEIFDKWGTPTRAAGRFVSIVDLGFGCGDQTLAVMRVPKRDASRNITEHVSMFDNYIGITINRGQFEYAKARFKDAGLVEDTVNVFCADAANPRSWNEDLKEAIVALDAESNLKPDPNTGVMLKNEVWVLALDCLYHFKPSRVPIFTYAARNLKANIMAFDLVLADNISILDHQLVKVVGWLMGCPPGAFLTKLNYRCQLHMAGYRLDHCEVHDISEHVFAPLAKFLRRRQQELKVIGLSLGKLKVAMWLFEWWARRPVIRGVIVVAKHHERQYGPP